jgi:hypothetical protein
LPRIGISTVKSSSSSSRLSDAEAKSRVRKLQREVDSASRHSRKISATGLFKEACSTDLLFLIDTTGSMNSYIEAAKQQVKSIMDDIKRVFLNEAEVRVAVVGYKDHSDSPNIQFLDFTPSADRVRSFLDGLKAIGGSDIPEDVLGGIQQAINASWKQQSRCMLHIADAPAHGRSLHDLGESQDDYIKPGSEPHGLTYEPLLRRLAQLKINYGMLRIRSCTDRMALAFSRVYAAVHADTKLHIDNTYHSQGIDTISKAGSAHWSGSAKHDADLQFEELQLGTSYSALRHLVVKSATSSASRTASRLMSSLSSSGKGKVTRAGRSTNPSAFLSAIREDEYIGGTTGDVALETTQPKWNIPSWLDVTLEVDEAFCPNVAVHSAGTLNKMMARDDNIGLSAAQLTVRMRSRPFAQGAMRLAYYARTAASSNKFVAKAFKEDDKGLAHVVEDMRSQALCKAFALEFNGLWKSKHPLDFIVTTCLETKAPSGTEKQYISLEPFIDGPYVKYNSNNGYVMEDSSDGSFNLAAQAFSHFTFERSMGCFLVSDLQGVGHLLTDPAIQTKDTERFKLSDTNLNEEGFKFFFATHTCNSICRKLGLQSNREGFAAGNCVYRDEWPSMEPTVCCSNKLCRGIIRLASAHKSDQFPGHHWCKECWPQLKSTTERWICSAPGPNHEYDVSRFFYESQGQLEPRRCADHLERDETVSSADVVGESLWSAMKSADKKGLVSGRVW